MPDQLCYFMPAKYLIETLQKKRLKVSRFSSCNDIHELGNHKIPKHKKLPKRKTDRKVLRDWALEQDKIFGLICFSRHHYSPLMWAHYADRNRGACLVFNKRKSAKSTDFLNVNYTKNRQFFKGKPPECISTLIGKNHSELIRLCATKELDWAYEEETRLLLNLNGSTTNEKNSHFWEWDETLELVNVYVGADPEVCVKSVELACKDSKIRVLQKRGAFTDFRVVEQENTNLWKKCPKMTAAKAIIEHLNLAPHPEGGWYRQTWLAEGEGRPSGSAIYYLLEAGQRSHWHRIDATEIWHFHAGAPLVLTTAAVDAGPVVETILGPDILAGQQAQMIVPIQHWQAAHSMGDYTLVSCTVSPAFHFEGFHMAKAGWVPGFQA